MDSRTSAQRSFEDFEPSTKWSKEAGADIFTVHLPEFRKEQLRVQVTSARNLRITGERPLGNNKFRRFQKEFPIESNYDTNGIRAKFENERLHITLPKIIVPAADLGPEMPPAQPPLQAQQPQKPAVPPATAPQGKAQPPSAEGSKPEKPPAVEPTVVQKPPPQLEGPSKTSMEKQKGATENGGAANAAPIPAISQKSPEKKMKTEELTEAGKVTATSSTSLSTKDEKKDDRDTKEAYKTAVSKGSESAMQSYKKAFSGLVMEVKRPRMFMCLVLVVLSVAVLWLYAMNAIRSITTSEIDEI